VQIAIQLSDLTLVALRPYNKFSIYPNLSFGEKDIREETEVDQNPRQRLIRKNSSDVNALLDPSAHRAR
jgi:hypothetical protein